jgi:hypothetical protein
MSMEKRSESTGVNTKKISLFSGPGTRRWPRFNLSDVPSIREVRSSSGNKVYVADISREGALLRTRMHLAPKTRIHLNVVTAEGLIPISGFVLRSLVRSPEGMVEYQAAVAFDRPLKILDGCPAPAADTSDAAAIPPFLSGAFPSDGDALLSGDDPDGDSSMIDYFLGINILDERNEIRSEMLKLNDW